MKAYLLIGYTEEPRAETLWLGYGADGHESGLIAGIEVRNTLVVAVNDDLPLYHLFKGDGRSIELSSISTRT